MTPTTTQTHQPDVSFDGGDLDCGNGLLLLLRKQRASCARVIEFNFVHVGVSLCTFDLSVENKHKQQGIRLLADLLG